MHQEGVVEVGDGAVEIAGDPLTHPREVSQRCLAAVIQNGGRDEVQQIVGGGRRGCRGRARVAAGTGTVAVAVPRAEGLQHSLHRLLVSSQSLGSLLAELALVLVQGELQVVHDAEGVVINRWKGGRGHRGRGRGRSW